jgi:hypothetical protein
VTCNPIERIKKMRKLAYLSLLLAVLITLGGGIVACPSEPTTPPDESAVRAYADPATETTLQGLSEANLEKYTQYGNDDFKAAVTPEVFAEAVAQINSQLGAYQSKEFLSTDEQQGYIVVHYRAKFAKGETGVRMVFDKDHLVAGQWFE